MPRTAASASLPRPHPWPSRRQYPVPQCGRFHPLDAFAPGMRSCRKQLAKHAERRRRGRELAAQAAAAAAAAAGGGKPGGCCWASEAAVCLGCVVVYTASRFGEGRQLSPLAMAALSAPLLYQLCLLALPSTPAGASTAAPAAKRPRSVALNAPEPATVGAARLLQPPSTWRISDSTGSGGSSGLHQSVPESGVDALLAAAEEDALAEAEGMDEDTGLLKQEPQQDAPPLRLEPDPAWFAGAATVPLPPPPLPAAATLGGLGPALPGAGAADAAMAAALAALGGGPAALAVAAAQQAQQAQLLTLLLAQQQQQQQRQRQSALAALLSTGLPVQPDSTALALALMQQSGQAAAVPPQATLLQQLLGGGAGGGAAALLQQAVAQQQVQQQVPPLLDDRQSIRERHVAVLYRAAVERLMQTVLQVAPQALALPGALAQLQAQPLTQNAQQPEPQQPTGQPAQQQQQQQQQSAPPVQQQQQQQQQEQQQRPAAASPVPHVIVVTPVPAQPLSPPQQGQPASQPVSPLAQHPQ